MSQQTLRLYRAILKSGKHYPSSNRHKLLDEAKALFREHKDLQDPNKVANELEKARLGLQELQMYAPQQVQNEGGDMSVTLRGGTLPDSQSTDFLK